MDTDTVLQKVREQKAALRQRGVESLSLFGSRAMGTARADSDFDFAVRLSPDMTIGGLAFAAIEIELEKIIGSDVDLVAEPARKARVQKQIDRWRQRVF